MFKPKGVNSLSEGRKTVLTEFSPLKVYLFPLTLLFSLHSRFTADEDLGFETCGQTLCSIFSHGQVSQTNTNVALPINAE